MAVSVLAIKFNHDTNAATHDALNIRIDAGSTVDVPEWTAGETAASQSPAAYAIKAVGGNTITVQARFQSDEAVKVLEVRAVFVVKSGASKTPLGDLASTPVIFNAQGFSGFVSFRCLSGLGTTVRAKNIVWKWQFRTMPGGVWTDFGTTRHRIYVLLGVPTAPWQQTPNTAANLQLPWTDVLDIACAWAANASTRDGAAGLITDHVNGLGPGTVQYDCPGDGTTHYTSMGMFNCTAFVDLVNGGAGNGIFVNCTDCCTFVSTCANILGCDLWQSRIEVNFQLNEILADRLRHLADRVRMGEVHLPRGGLEEPLHRGGPALRRLPAGRRRSRSDGRRSALPDAAEEHRVRVARTGVVSGPARLGGRAAQVQPGPGHQEAPAGLLRGAC